MSLAAIDTGVAAPTLIAEVVDMHAARRLIVP
jgi:hypothetical protein